jgi:hypothetical protein
MQGVVKPWVDECLKNHHGCQEVQQLSFQSYAPTRLIDVGTTHEDTVKLVDSAGLSKPRYLIFSYCWGASNDRSKTTRANIEQRRESIQMAALPKAIRDAISVTRLMGVQYLWVDAMCIIQEDKEKNDGFLEDWKVEAAKMARYYSNALCCISNLSATGSSEGFLPETKAALGQGNQQRILAKHKHTGVEHFKYKDREFTIYLPRHIESWHTEWNTSPLMCRAWALQEWVLSRRILHCSKVGMFMECARGVCQINDPFPEPGAAWHRNEGSELSGMLIESSKAEVGTLWTKLVTFYSAMNLTNPADRLVAIDGIARLICAKYSIGYFAGVLSSHIAQTLLWKRNRPEEEEEGNSAAVFPSWSWSSTKYVEFPKFENCASYVTCTDDGCFRLSDKVVNYADPCTRLFPLRGPILSFPVISSSKLRFPYISLLVDCNSPFWGQKGIAIYMDSTKEWAKLEKLATDGEEMDLLGQWRLLLCLKSVTKKEDVFHVHKSLYCGLLVENLKDIGTNAYRRIGYFELESVGLEEPDLNSKEWMTDINLF